MKNIIWVFFISLLPIVELRGAIPVGAALEIPFYINFLSAVVGNLLPVPFILLFIPKILDFLAKFKLFKPVVDWLRKKALKGKGRIVKNESQESPGENTEILNEPNVPEKKRMPLGAFLGLLLFVLIPLPGTGAWTGALVASLFDFPKKKSFLAIVLGVLGAGVIMCLASYGVVGFLSFLL